MTAKISIIIPTYNRKEYLQQAIESAKQQNYKNLEIVILDNASDDGTENIVNMHLDDPRIVSVRNETNLGMVGNWNKALHEVITGDWFLILSDDDYLTDPNYLSLANQQIAQNPKVLLVYANGVMKNETTGEITPTNIPFSGIASGVDVLLSRGSVRPIDFTLCNVLFHTQTSRVIDCFTDPDNLCCDSELFMKLCARGEVACLEPQVSVYRVHDTSLTNTQIHAQKVNRGHWMFLANTYQDIRRNNLLTPANIKRFEQNVISQNIRGYLAIAAKASPRTYKRVKQEMILDYDNSNLVNQTARSPRVTLKLFLKLTRSHIKSLIKRVFSSKK